jgi:hypothetical protein
VKPGPRRLLGLLYIGLAGPAFGAEDPGSVVELPPVVVTDSRLLPKPEAWRYGRVADFEILSNASDSTTRSTVRDLLEFRQAVSVVWPAMQPKSSAPPVYLILCGKKDKFQDFVAENVGNAYSGTVSLSLREKEQAALVLDLETTLLNLSGAGSGATVGAGQTVGVVAASGGGFSAATIGSPSTSPISQIEVDQRQQLHREYVHFLLGRLNPRPAPWIEEGLAQLLASMTYSRTSIEFAKLPDANRVTPHQAMVAAAGKLTNMQIGGADPSLAPPDSGAAQDKAFNESLAFTALMPMDQMFAVTRDSAEAMNAIGGLWSKQCWMFVHLCLYGENKRYQKAFIDFVTRSAREPVTEDLFKQCFKMNYRQMLLEFRSYAQDTDYKSVTFKGGKLPDVPDLVLGDATEPEIGRIKGEALRMAGHAEAAHLTLIAPYIRGERDPELLASIGLDELESGKADRAAKFLEAAVAKKTIRARAYMELGRLWLAQAEAKPDGADGRLSADQMIHVLTPLFAGRMVPPPLQKSYETIAEVWSKAALKPSRDNLAVVNEGVSRFPSDTDLMYTDAVLHAQNGMKDTALKLADMGVTASKDPAVRDRFTALKASLAN